MIISECVRQPNLSEEGEEEQEKKERSSWNDIPLHGMYHQQTEVAYFEKIYQCLVKTELRDSTEALIMVAQEYSLNTRLIEARHYHTRQDPRCRMCKDGPETVQHLTAGC